jgi:WD40 repeat protein
MRFLSVNLVFILSILSNQAEVSFMKEIAPVLQQRCTGCHGAKKSEGNYRLHTFEYLQQAVTPGNPNESDFYLLAIDPDPEFRMPQEDDPLSKIETELIRQWIEQGAIFDGENPSKSFTSQAPPRTHPNPPSTYRVPAPIMAMAFSNDGEELAIAGHHEVTIWDPNTGLLLRRLKNLPLRIQSIQWLPEGKQFVIGGGTAGEYGELSLIDAMTGFRLTTFDTFEDLVLGVGLDQTGERVAAVSADRTVRVYDLASNTPLWISHVHSDWATSVAFSPDSQFVISTSRDQTVKVLSANDGALFTTYNGHRRNYGDFAGRFKIFAGCFDSKSGLALSVGEGKAIRVWDPIKTKEENGTAGDMEERFFNAGHTRYISHSFEGSAFVLALEGDRVYTAGSDGLIRSFEFSTGKQELELHGHQDWIYALSVSSESELLATGSHDGEIRIWDTRNGNLLRSFIAAPGYRGPEFVGPK